MLRSRHLRPLLLFLILTLIFWSLVRSRAGERNDNADEGQKNLDEPTLVKAESATELNSADALSQQSVNPPLQSSSPNNKTINHDPYTCRHRHSRYARPMTKNAKLTAFLQRYNRLHDRFQREWPIGKALSASLTTRNNTVRYLIYSPDYDVGSVSDQALEAYGLLSAFLFALLSDRVLLVPHGSWMEEYLCEPFTRSSWLVSKETIESVLKDARSADFATVIRSRRPRRALSVQMDRDAQKLACIGNVKESFAHIQTLILTGRPTVFADALLTNSAHDQQLWDMFSSGAIIGPLYENLVHPNNRLWREDMPALLRAYSDSSIERPLKIAAIGSPFPRADVISSSIKRHLSNESGDDMDMTVSLLVAPSNADKLEDLAASFTPPAFLVAASAAHFHQPQEEWARFLADMMLARHSDALILTDSKTPLGWLAAAIRQQPSIMISRDGSSKIIPSVDHWPKASIKC